MKPYTIIATAVMVAAACGTARAQGVALNGKNANGEVTCTGRVMTQDFLYGEDIPEIEWTLGDSAKTILGYRCHTATCSFRGRDYTVWYTTDIPARYGPWKFSGLPGLVLEACDSDSLFTFKACKIYRTTGSIDMPKYTFLKAKKEQYMKAKKLQFVNLAQACRLYLVNTGWKMVEDGKPDKIKEMKWSFIERD